ncbi:unnamed protein product [Rotaria magnacalcarata]|uniref:Uncharacterized protein n=1 Tax=Rotaria magnacalcarata TaxID=392030 RepID=A0A8S3CZL1_9BILA|nr:unnamed protein product [Rotaria magnacalcarata]
MRFALIVSNAAVARPALRLNAQNFHMGDDATFRFLLLTGAVDASPLVTSFNTLCFMPDDSFDFVFVFGVGSFTGCLSNGGIVSMGTSICSGSSICINE